MSEWYFISLLLAAGICLGFLLHAATLLKQTRNVRHLHLVLLAALQAAYCFVAYQYFRTTLSARALPWGQSICAFTPYITYLFGELTIALTGGRQTWLRRFQQVNLALTTVFVLGVLLDIVWATSLVLKPVLHTDLAAAFRHQLSFTAAGTVYLVWVSLAFGCFATLLLSRYRSRRDLLPMVLGSVVYFVATILDFGILIGAHSGYFLQHFGFFALVVGCWWVLARRFEHSLKELQEALLRLEDQRQQLLMAQPLLHKQKLDSLGTLAAGVAHEINNPIHGIMNYAFLLERRLSPGEERQFATEIVRESERIAGIVRNLLRFGRAEEAHSVAADIGDIVEGTLCLLRSSLIKDGITLQVEIAPDVPELVCRAQQLQQVLMNLLTNARDALNSRAPERTEPKRIVLRASSDTRRGSHWVRIDISDNGDGFESELAERIFDPFFTTKAEGAGTGLGLSVSHGIVLAHGGTLTATSEPGRGAHFSLAIPCHATSDTFATGTTRDLPSTPHAAEH